MYLLSIEKIMEFLPHRPPFLFLDRILEIVPSTDIHNRQFGSDHIGTKVVAQKNLTFGENFFHGHFPGFPIMPGVIIIEAMAQTMSFSMYPYIAHNQAGEVDWREKLKSFQCILVGVDEARFRVPVVPGDVLKLESTVTRCRGKIWGFECKATVDSKLVAEAKIMANLSI